MPFKSLVVSAAVLLAIVCCADAYIDPWTYSARSWLWTPVINATTVYQMGPETNSNWFWGFALQFQWQYKSGRLANSGDNISPNSWWADMNYYLTIPPYLIAADLGMVPEEEFLPPKTNKDKFCLTVDSCDQTLMSRWYAVMETIQQIEEGKSQMSQDELVQIVWDAHAFTINYGIGKFGTEADLLSGQEWRFSHGWALFVEFVAATHFLTNYTNVVQMQVFLPPRVLKNTDIPPFISDMSAGTNAMVGSMMAVHLLDKVGGLEPLLSLWQRAMQTPRCRMLGRYAITNFLVHPVDSLIEIFKGVISSCSNSDPAILQMLKPIQVHPEMWNM